jgi:hypothetical protein
MIAGLYLRAGDYIVTKDGFRGYILRRLDYAPSLFEVRMASGVTVRSGEDLKPDPLMQDIPQGGAE